MPRITRRTIFERLSHPEVVKLARLIFVRHSLPRSKRELIDCLVSTRRFNTTQILELLTCSELDRLCLELNLSPGRRKSISIARLTQDSLAEAKELVKDSLKKQGYGIQNGLIIPPSLDTKAKVREMHSLAVQHKREAAKAALAPHESELLSFIADGNEVNPIDVRPTLRFVESRSTDELLFRYAALHWNIPISSGYGRRLRALVVDESNDKLIGLIGLCDPVYNLRSRDDWVGWTQSAKSTGIKRIVDAYVLGAVPPYSHLLCGKLVALLACSSEVQNHFAEKYRDTTSLISKSKHDGCLAAITTTSALGRSSIYNRLKHSSTLAYHPIGYTVGTGDFQFLNGTYELIRDAVSQYGNATAKHANWGAGFRNRREVVQEFLKAADIPQNALRHGIRRQVFIAPLGRNAPKFLCGEDGTLDAFEWTTDELAEAFLARWLLPRSNRDSNYRSFRKADWRLWT